MPDIIVVDEHDNVIGQADRVRIREEGLRHRIVRVFLLRRRSARGTPEILLQQRARHLRDNPLKWDQSAGGHVEVGDTDGGYAPAARRETLEELGVTVTDLILAGEVFYIERPTVGGYYRRFQQVFYTTRWDGALRLQTSEIDHAQWYPVPEVAAWLEQRPGDFTNNFPAAFVRLQGALGYAPVPRR